MRTKEPLTKTQLLVIEDLARGDRDLPEILKLRRVSRVRFKLWQSDLQFIEAMQQRIEFGYRRAMALVAREAQEAVNCLVALTHSEKDESARKACPDIIAMARQTSGTRESNAETTEEQEDPWTPDQAARILAIMAEDHDNQDDHGA